MHSRKIKILQNIFGSYDNRGTEILFQCPMCDHHKKKLSVNLDKNAWKCWVCDYSGFKLKHLIRRHGGYREVTAWRALEGDLAIPTNFREFFLEKFNSVEQKDFEVRIELPEEFRTLTEVSKEPDFIRALSYLIKRGFSREDILRWKIGYCSTGEYRGRIIIPSFGLSGYVNYFIARTYKDDWMKYKNPKIPKQDIIFNHLYIDWTRDLVLVEGAFDAIRVGNAVPILGSSLSKNSALFQSIIIHDTPIYVALDQDAESKALRLIEELIKYDIDVFKVDTSGYPDVAEMPLAIFEERKKRALPMNFNTLMQHKIRISV